MNVQRDGVGFVIPRHRQGRGAERRHQTLEPFLPRRFQHETGEVQVVFDDEEDAVAGADGAAVVADLVDQLRLLARDQGEGSGVREDLSLALRADSPTKA